MASRVIQPAAATATHAGLPDVAPDQHHDEVHAIAGTDHSGVGPSGVASGIANPATADPGDRFWRSDLGLEVYYTGSRWVTTQLFSLSLPMLGGEATGIGFNINTNNTRNFGQVAPGGVHDLFVERISWVFFLGPTNGAANFWAFTVKRAVSGGVVGAAFNSSAAAPNTWWSGDQAVGAVMTTASCKGGFELDPVKTGNPSNIAGGVALSYRLVVT